MLFDIMLLKKADYIGGGDGTREFVDLALAVGRQYGQYARECEKYTTFAYGS